MKYFKRNLLPPLLALVVIAAAALALQTAPGAVLTGAAEGAALTADGSPLDLTRLFGAMEPGEGYPLRLAAGKAEYDYCVMRSANLPSLHVTLDAQLPRS